MSLSVLTPAASTDVITLASVKRRLGVTDSGSDVELAENIEEVTSALREFFGGELARQTYLEEFEYETAPGVPRDSIGLACKPIDPDSVTLTINDFPLTGWYVKNADAGLLKRDRRFPSFQGGVIGTAPGSWQISVTYFGGFAYGVTPWTPSQEVAEGSWVHAVLVKSALRYVCTTAGTTGAAEPMWPLAGLTVLDGDAVWTARVATDFPATIRQLAYFAIRDAFMSQGRPSDLVRSEGEGFSEVYSKQGAAGTLSLEVRQALEPLRLRYGR